MRSSSDARDSLPSNSESNRAWNIVWDEFCDASDTPPQPTASQQNDDACCFRRVEETSDRAFSARYRARRRQVCDLPVVMLKRNAFARTADTPVGEKGD